MSKNTLEEIWNGPDLVRLRQAISAGYVDRVCRHAGCSFVQDTEKAAGIDAYDLRCTIGEEVSLRDSWRTDHLVSGWSQPEHWGTWSEGKVARLILDLSRRPARNVVVKVLCRGAGSKRHCSTRIAVNVNGFAADDWDFRYPESTEDGTWRELTIPRQALCSNRIDVRFMIANPLSPTLWGSTDTRLIGLGVSALCVCLADGGIN